MNVSTLTFGAGNYNLNNKNTIVDQIHVFVYRYACKILRITARAPACGDPFEINYLVMK